MNRLWSKKKLLIGLVVVAVALVGASIAVPVLAQTGNANGPVNTYNNVYLDSPTMARLAGVLGITPTELSNQLQTGKTLATIAQEKNVPATSLVDAIIAPYADQIASQLKYGYITQAQSQAFLDTARQQATYLLGQNLSVAPGNGNGYYSYGYCGAYGNGGYGPVYGWGMMGPGMMGGRGGYYGNPTPAPGSNTPASPGGNTVPTQPWNGGRGWGMMGRGCW